VRAHLNCVASGSDAFQVKVVTSWPPFKEIDTLYIQTVRRRAELLKH
jgi:hypothetical protein